MPVKINKWLVRVLITILVALGIAFLYTEPAVIVWFKEHEKFVGIFCSVFILGMFIWFLTEI